MSKNNLSEVKLSKSSYELAKKLITLSKVKQNKANAQKQQINRTIGSTDYAKYEAMAKEIERENVYSNTLVTKGLTKDEQAQLQKYLSVLEKNARENWNFVKNGGKRKY